MIRLMWWTFVWLLTAPIVTGFAQAQSQCEGSAQPGTTYTATNDCSQAATALEWSLTISCRDACGEEWTTLGPQRGTASSHCSTVPPSHYCSPSWKRLNYKSGRFAETSAYSADYSLLEGCHKGPETITAGTCPCAPPCGNGEDPVPPPDQCASSPEYTSSTLGLGAVRSADPQALPSGFFSNRQETVDGMRYIMEDWVVVVANSSETLRSLQVRRSSSSRLSDYELPLDRIDRGEAEGDEAIPSPLIGLVIEKPVHPDNSRMIPTPAISLNPAALPYLGRSVTAAVRVDVASDRTIRDVQVLSIAAVRCRLASTSPRT